jgi:AAA family ATP:ADP antiporter
MPPPSLRDRPACVTEPLGRHPTEVTTPSLVARALARAFRPFAKVKPEESGTAALMTLTAFLLLTAYYLLKTVREPLILTQGGAEVKLYARAAQGVLMVGVVHVYGELARRVGRMKLLAIVFAFFISNLVIFAVLAATPLRIGLAFFLWVGVFSYTVVAQFWALAADIFTEEQGKRLFPIIGGGSSVGAVAGAWLAKSLVAFGPAALMGTSAVILVVCASLILWVERRAGAPQAKAHEPHPDAPLSGESAFHLLARDRYLVLIAFMVLLLNWVNSSGEYILDRTLLAAGETAHLEGAALRAFIGAFKADYFAWYNLIGVVLQLLAVSRILSRLGVRNALLFLPGFALVGYGAAAFAPVLSVLRLVKIGENSLQYSVADTARNALFLVTSRVEKYVGKTAVDTIAVRCGAIMSSAVVLVGTRLALPTAAFAAINVVLTATWIAVVFAMRPEHARRSEEGEKELAAEPVPS